MMRYLFFLVISLLFIWVLYSLNIEYEWVELQFKWTDLEMGIAALSGPIQFLWYRFKKEEESHSLKKKSKYQTLKHDEFLERKQNLEIQKSPSVIPHEIKEEKHNQFNINGPTYG